MGDNQGRSNFGTVYRGPIPGPLWASAIENPEWEIAGASRKTRNLLLFYFLGEISTVYYGKDHRFSREQAGVTDTESGPVFFCLQYAPANLSTRFRDVDL